MRYLSITLVAVLLSSIANAATQDKFFSQLRLGLSHASKYQNTNNEMRDVTIDSAASTNSYFAGVGVGYIVNDPIRFGLFFYNSSHDFKGSHKWNIEEDQMVNESKMKIKSNSLMIEGTYRFNLNSKKCISNKPVIFEVTPYLSFGIGAVLNNTSGKIISSNPNISVPDWDMKIKNHRNISLSWSLGFGLEFPINEKLKFDVGFKYLDYGKAKTSSKSELYQDGQLLSNADSFLDHGNIGTKLSVKTITLGLTYQF